MSKHTPGPWNITDDENHPANLRITSNARRHIAKVYASALNKEDALENARLIAAAPDLLAACINALQRLDGSDSPSDQQAATACREAIAQAEGTDL